MHNGVYVNKALSVFFEKEGHIFGDLGFVHVSAYTQTISKLDEICWISEITNALIKTSMDYLDMAWSGTFVAWLHPEPISTKAI